MKKILSIVLLLTLCLGLFAGCDKAPSEATGNLANAKALVFNTYKPANKDEVPSKSADFELISSVLVDGVSYPVTWALEVTAGGADAVKLVDGSAAGVKKVDLTEKPEAEVRFTLTATISDKDGNTETVSFNFMTPAFEAPTAEKVVILNVANKLYATGTEYEYVSSSTGKAKMELVLDADKSKALPYTLITNEDGSVSFKTDCGKYLYCDANSVEFAAEMGDYTKFILEAAEGGYMIKCAVANYNGNPQYLEIYNGYLTCYSLKADSDTGLFIFALEAADGANGTVVEHAPAVDTDPSEPSAPDNSSDDPAADTELSVKDAIALGASKEHDTYTSGKYYVVGEITEIYNEQYGNMKIKDADGNILTIYGTYSADGSVRFDKLDKKPAVGDTIKVYGIIGQYKDTPQMKNGWIVEQTAGAGGNDNAGNDNTGSEDKNDPPAASGTMHVEANGEKWYVTIFDGKSNPALEATNSASEAGKVSVTLSKDGKTAKIKVGDHYIAPKGGNENGLKEGEYDWAVVKNSDGSYKFMGQGEDTVTLCLNVYQDYNKFRAYKNSNLEAHPESYFYNFIVK